MKITIPLVNGAVSQHFGNCEEFVFVTVAADGRSIAGMERLAPPPHEPGVLPRWLREQGAEVVIAAGIGVRAQELLTADGIRVVAGVTLAPPEELAAKFLQGSLEVGDNQCAH